MHLNLAALALLSAVVVPSTAQSVHTVGPNEKFQTIQAAVDAAQVGDTVLVRPGGPYLGATINKGIEVLGDGIGSAPMSIFRIIVENLPATERCRIAGLSGLGGLWSCLTVRNCRGAVWIEGQRFPPNTYSISVEDCDSVTIVGGTFAGDQSCLGPTIRRSTVFAFDATFVGVGGDPTSSSRRHGGSGLLIEDSFVYLQSSTAQGGVGAIGLRTCRGGNGGTGLEATGSSTCIVERQSQSLGGAPGVGTWPGSCTPALSGVPMALQSGVSLRSLGTPTLQMSAPALAREGMPIDYTIDGPPGSFTVLGLSLDLAPIWLPTLDVPLLLGAAFAAIPVGTIPATGQLVVPTIAPQQFTVDAQRYFVQVFAIDPNGQLLNSAARGVTTVDSRI